MAEIKVYFQSAVAAVKKTDGASITYTRIDNSIRCGHVKTGDNKHDYTVSGLWRSYGFDLTNYTISNARLAITLSQAAVSSGTEFCVLPAGMSAASGTQSIYDATMSATMFYKCPYAYGGNSIIYAPIPDKETLILILQRGLGLRKPTALDNDVDYFYNVGHADEPYIEFDFADTTIPPYITAISPKSQTVIANNDITFSWTFYQQAEEPQSHYDLQFSSDGGQTWVTYADKVASTEHFCTLPGGTLSSGTYLWRARAWTINGTVPSNWTDPLTFIARMNPETSDISCDGKPMPTISWTASEQQAFQIRFGNYDTGAIFSNASSYKLPQYFDDNAYALTMRTQNLFGIWSDWTEVIYVQITNTPGAAIVLLTWQSGNGAGLSWDTAGTYTAYYVYRDGVPIAKVTGKAYTDDLAAGDCVYQVRGILGSRLNTRSVHLFRAGTTKTTACHICILPGVNTPYRRGPGSVHDG
jgi:hypothetical protein